ncbi:hypothetical protein D3C79_297430 [compost metagenome]
MLFVLFDASLVLHHPGDEIQGHPHILAMGQLCPSVKPQRYAYLYLHPLSIVSNTNSYLWLADLYFPDAPLNAGLSSHRRLG